MVYFHYISSRRVNGKNKLRDLFDLWLVLDKELIDIDLTFDIYQRYCKHKEIISKNDFIKNIAEKDKHPDFRILLKEDINRDFDKPLSIVQSEIIDKLP